MRTSFINCPADNCEKKSWKYESFVGNYQVLLKSASAPPLLPLGQRYYRLPFSTRCQLQHFFYYFNISTNELLSFHSHYIWTKDKPNRCQTLSICIINFKLSLVQTLCATESLLSFFLPAGWYLSKEIRMGRWIDTFTARWWWLFTMDPFGNIRFRRWSMGMSSYI